MIYESIASTEELQQGDIFRSVPRSEISLSRLAIVAEDGQTEQATWQELIQSDSLAPIPAIVALKPVMAIVVSQNCDAARGKDISLCAVEPLSEHLKDNHSPNPKKWNNQLLKHAHNPRYFYLPADPSVGIPDRMSADFRSIIRLDRDDILKMRGTCRVARLGRVAAEHFRESLAQFFRRYPVNEWYPLTKDEAAVYATEQNLDDDDLYEWQR